MNTYRNEKNTFSEEPNVKRLHKRELILLRYANAVAVLVDHI